VASVEIVIWLGEGLWYGVLNVDGQERGRVEGKRRPSDVMTWLSADAERFARPDSEPTCGCGFEDVDWNGQRVRRWFHEPECLARPENERG
jgi:hypothetical protein